jgi:hypothetical protein
MTTIIQGTQLRDIALGRYVQGQEQDITTEDAAGTFSLFAVTGGEVLVTALWGVVTTAVTVANTVNLQTNPTTGDTVVVVTATDIGTTDTAAGTTIQVMEQGDGTTDLVKGGGHALGGLVVTTGQIESLITGTNPDGVIDWYCTWVPLTPGAVLAASTTAFAAT